MFLCCITPRVDVKVHHRCRLHGTGDEQAMRFKDLTWLRDRRVFIFGGSDVRLDPCLCGSVGEVIFFFFFFLIYLKDCVVILYANVLWICGNKRNTFVFLSAFVFRRTRGEWQRLCLSCSTVLMKCFGVNYLIIIRVSQNWSRWHYRIYWARKRVSRRNILLVSLSQCFPTSGTGTRALWVVIDYKNKIKLNVAQNVMISIMCLEGFGLRK